jgi:DNA-binding transcriptional LysR family regulator
MDMRHLEAFLTVAEEHSFTKAARRLHLSQPPVSLRIKELENELLVTLFERSTRSVALTPAGQVFFERVREVLVALESAVEASRRVARGITGRLRISYTGIGSDLVLPRLIRAFRARHPAVNLEIQGPSPSGPLELALLNGEIDVAVSFLPLRERDLATRTLATPRLGIALPDRHPLAGLKHVPVKRLKGEAFVAYPANKGFFLRQAIDAECIRAGFRPRVVKESPASQSLLCLVAAGTGVAIMPMENKWRGTEGVVFRPLWPKERGLRYGLAWRRADRGAALRQFLAVAAEVFP